MRLTVFIHTSHKNFLRAFVSECSLRRNFSGLVSLFCKLLRG